jgi:hypothetical protein
LLDIFACIVGKVGIFPRILSQEPGEAGERSRKERASQGLDLGRGVSFFSQLDKAHNEGRKELEREV